MRKLALILTCMLLSFSAFAQDMADSLTIYFRPGISVYEPEFKNNGKNMDQFLNRVSFIQQDSLKKIIKVSYIAGASPEGLREKNEILAKDRAASISNYLHKRISFANNAIESVLRTEDYIELANMVAQSNMPYRDEVLEILRTYPTEKMVDGVLRNPCKSALIALRGGAPWKYMKEHYFPALRRFKMLVVVGIERPLIEEPAPAPAPVVEQPAEVVPEPTPEPAPAVVEPVVAPKADWCPQMHIKTNAIGWGMAISNLALEFDLVKHLSFNMPVYYSGINYFTETVKFRMVGLYPEFRYWFKESDGWFIGAHGGVAWFNYALGGDWRIQDTNGNSPALGGGLNVGFRMPLSKKNPRWKVEFSLGAGVYDVKYEKFVNEKDGPKAQGSFRKTAVALDNVGVSFSYSLNLKKRNK